MYLLDIMIWHAICKLFIDKGRRNRASTCNRESYERQSASQG